MPNSKPSAINRPRRIPRSGHGAASVIPHLNDMFRLEPSNLENLMPDEKSVWQEKPGSEPASDARADGG